MNFFLDSNTLTNKIKKIGNKSVEEKQNLSFALIVTDSSIKNLEFSLEKNLQQELKLIQKLVNLHGHYRDTRTRLYVFYIIKKETGYTSGASFMTGFNQFYYSFSPTIADWERSSPAFKEAIKITLIPLLTSLSILNYVDVDSEEEMLGFGIGIILLNLGIYVLGPVLGVMKFGNYTKHKLCKSLG